MQKVYSKQDALLNTIDFPPSRTAPLGKSGMQHRQGAMLQLAEPGLGQMPLELYNAREHLIRDVWRKTNNASGAGEEIGNAQRPQPKYQRFGAPEQDTIRKVEA